MNPATSLFRFFVVFYLFVTVVVALPSPGSAYYALAARVLAAPAELRGRSYHVLQPKASSAETQRRAPEEIHLPQDERAIFESVAPIGRAERFYAVQKKRDEQRRRRRDIEQKRDAEDTLLSHSGTGPQVDSVPTAAKPSFVPAVPAPPPSNSGSSISSVTPIPPSQSPTSSHEKLNAVNRSSSSSQKLKLKPKAKPNSAGGKTKVNAKVDG